MKVINLRSYEQPKDEGFKDPVLRNCAAECIASGYLEFYNAFDHLPEWKDVDEFRGDLFSDGYFTTDHHRALGILPRAIFERAIIEHETLSTFVSSLNDVGNIFDYCKAQYTFSEDAFTLGLMQKYFNQTRGDTNTQKDYAEVHCAFSQPFLDEWDLSVRDKLNEAGALDEQSKLYPHVFDDGDRFTPMNAMYPNAARLLIGIGALEKCVENGLEIKFGKVQE